MSPIFHMRKVRPKLVLTSPGLQDKPLTNLGFEPRQSDSGTFTLTSFPVCYNSCSVRSSCAV